MYVVRRLRVNSTVVWPNVDCTTTVNGQILTLIGSDKEKHVTMKVPHTVCTSAQAYPSACTLRPYL
jgi:hypothetical protein